MNQVLDNNSVVLETRSTLVTGAPPIDPSAGDGAPGRHAAGFERPNCWRGWTSLACWCTASGCSSVLIHPHHLDF